MQKIRPTIFKTKPKRLKFYTIRTVCRLQRFVLTFVIFQRSEKLYPVQKKTENDLYG